MLTIAKRQYRKEKTIGGEVQGNQGEDDEGEGENIKFTTNQIALAPPEIRASYQEALGKKWHLETSNTTDAFRTIDGLFKFVPGKANGLSLDVCTAEKLPDVNLSATEVFLAQRESQRKSMGKYCQTDEEWELSSSHTKNRQVSLTS